MAGRSAAGPDEGRGQLQGICGAKRMQKKRPSGPFSDLSARFNFSPDIGQRGKNFSCLVFSGGGENLLAPEAGERGLAFDRRPPPRDDFLIFLGDFFKERGSGLL